MTDRKEEQQKAIEELSPEALKEKIESDKRKIIRNMIFIAAAAIALIAIGIAWFVSNSRVDASLGAVSAKYSGIEIGSSGSAGVHDDFLQEIKEAITYHLPNSNKHDTSQGGSINWLLNNDSNMNNYNDGKRFDDQNGAGLRKDYAMEPGTKGKLDFYIKSHDEGALSLDFSLDVTPYYFNTDTNTQTAVEESAVEAGLLSGHILYFLGETQSDKTIKYTWIKDRAFNIVIPAAEKDKEYNYSIYWVWPLNLSTILLNEEDSFLNENEVEFDDKDETGTLRNTIAADMEKNPEKYFFSSLTEKPLDTNYEEVKAIPEIRKKSGSDEAYDRQLFIDLSSYYNQADMKIGAGISFIGVTLRYQGISETTNKTTEAQNEG